MHKHLDKYLKGGRKEGHGPTRARSRNAETFSRKLCWACAKNKFWFDPSNRYLHYVYNKHNFICCCCCCAWNKFIYTEQNEGMGAGAGKRKVLNINVFLSQAQFMPHTRSNKTNKWWPRREKHFIYKYTYIFICTYPHPPYT